MTNRLDKPPYPRRQANRFHPFLLSINLGQSQPMTSMKPSGTQKQSSRLTDKKVPSRFEKQTPPERRANTSREDADAQLVNQTKNQIRQLVQEISDLAKTDCSVEDFYEGFLTRTTNALASTGGAIWIRESIAGTT